MASSVRSPKSAISGLLESPASFNFFQAIRLLESEGCAIHFKSAPSVEFLKHDIHCLKTYKKNNVCIETALFNILGADSVLPEPILEMAMSQAEQQDPILKDFIDCFNQRIIELSYQVWKYGEFALSLEHKESAKSFLLSLTGGQFACQALADESKVYYSGLLSHRSNESLQQMLSDFFELPVNIHSFQGEWISLGRACSNLGSAGQYNQLGKNTLLGKRVWQVQHRFTVSLGPLDYKAFLRLLPNGDWLKALRQIVQTYVGCEYTFSTELLLPSQLVPQCILNNETPFQLGWNTWLKSQHHSDIVFSVKPSHR